MSYDPNATFTLNHEQLLALSTMVSQSWAAYDVHKTVGHAATLADWQTKHDLLRNVLVDAGVWSASARV